jgi:hypothetical protein
VSTPIGTHGLSCINDDDYAAYAMSMQCNAQAADTAMQTDVEQLEEYISRAWITCANTAIVTVDDSASSGTIGPGGLLGEELFATNPNSQRNGIDPTASTWPPGIYMVGSTISWTFGALTANSNRQLQVYGLRRVSGSTSLITGTYDTSLIRDYQGEAGATGALSVVSFVDNRAGDLARAGAFISHANAASDMTVAVGAWKLWAMRLGSGLVV